MSGEREKRPSPAGEQDAHLEAELIRVKVADILAGTVPPSIAAPENVPDTEAFVATFHAAADAIPAVRQVLRSGVRSEKLQKMQRHPLRVSLDELERHRANVWQSGMGHDREQVAFGLLASLAGARINTEIEAADWIGRAEKVMAAVKHVEAARDLATELGDREAIVLSLALWRQFDSNFPDEDRLYRRASRRNRLSMTSQNENLTEGVGLREHTMTLRLHGFLKAAFGPKDSSGHKDRWRSGLIAELLSEATGKTITVKKVGRWISEYERALKKSSRIKESR